jgi:hypothetical protein
MSMYMPALLTAQQSQKASQRSKPANPKVGGSGAIIRALTSQGPGIAWPRRRGTPPHPGTPGHPGHPGGVLQQRSSVLQHSARTVPTFGTAHSVQSSLRSPPISILVLLQQPLVLLLPFFFSCPSPPSLSSTTRQLESAGTSSTTSSHERLSFLLYCFRSSTPGFRSLSCEPFFIRPLLSLYDTFWTLAARCQWLFLQLPCVSCRSPVYLQKQIDFTPRSSLSQLITRGITSSFYTGKNCLLFRVFGPRTLPASLR